MFPSCDDVLQYLHMWATDKLSCGTPIGYVTTGVPVLPTNTLLPCSPRFSFHFPRRLISVACHAVQNTQPLRCQVWIQWRVTQPVVLHANSENPLPSPGRLRLVAGLSCNGISRLCWTPNSVEWVIPTVTKHRLEPLLYKSNDEVVFGRCR
jgi:hypothetical protein